MTNLPKRYPNPQAATAAGWVRYSNEDRTGAISYVNTKYWDTTDPDLPAQLWYDVNGRLIGADFSVYRAESTAGPPNRFGIAPSRWITIPAHVHYVLKNANGTYSYGKAIQAQRYATANNGDYSHPTAAGLVAAGASRIRRPSRSRSCIPRSTTSRCGSFRTRSDSSPTRIRTSCRARTPDAAKTCEASRCAQPRSVVGPMPCVALTAQTPAPSPIPFIGGTHAKGFCATVRDNVAPSVLGLMKTDELIGAGHRATLKTAIGPDTRRRRTRSRWTCCTSRKVVASMTHNLGVIKKLLADESRFPKKPVTDDDRYALLLKSQLQETAARQTVALNHISGIVETVAMGNMRNDVDLQMQGTLGTPPPSASSSAPSIADQFLGVTALPGSGPGGMFSRPGVGVSNVRGQTIWDKLALDIEVQQAHIAGAEQALSPTVIAAATACKTRAPRRPRRQDPADSPR